MGPLISRGYIYKGYIRGPLSGAQTKGFRVERVGFRVEWI